MLYMLYTFIVGFFVIQALLIVVGIVFCKYGLAPIGILWFLIAAVIIPVQISNFDPIRQCEFVLNYKPTCNSDTKDCLETQLHWLQDSAKTYNRAYEQIKANIAIKDSLKTEINKYGRK